MNQQDVIDIIASAAIRLLTDQTVATVAGVETHDVSILADTTDGRARVYTQSYYLLDDGTAYLADKLAEPVRQYLVVRDELAAGDYGATVDEAVAGLAAKRVANQPGQRITLLSIENAIGGERVIELMGTLAASNEARVRALGIYIQTRLDPSKEPRVDPALPEFQRIVDTIAALGAIHSDEADAIKAIGTRPWTDDHQIENLRRHVAAAMSA